MAKMLNFGGHIRATDVSNIESAKVIPVSGTPGSNLEIQTTRDAGKEVIIFSIVLNNNRTDQTNVKVNLFVFPEDNANKKVSVGGGVIVIPGRPVSLDYKINLKPNDSMYVTYSGGNAGDCDILISAVQM